MAMRLLTGRDRREAVATARKVLQIDQYPDARFTACRFVSHPGGKGGGAILPQRRPSAENAEPGA